jgi:membrane protein implicated in regulation of membrane protease activity
VSSLSLISSHLALWLALAMLFGVAEAVRRTFFFLALSGAALLGALWAVVGASLLVQFLVFSLTGLLLLATRVPGQLQAWTERRRDARSPHAGQTVAVVGFCHDGLLVRYCGVEWHARWLSDELPALGALLEVVRLDGKTLVCKESARPR